MPHSYFFTRGEYLMPALISHYLLALKALDLYQKKGGAPVNRDAFLWGAQGPDFLFFQIPFPWRKTRSMNALGRRMHKDDPSGLLAALREYAILHKSDNIARSYLLGFLCHYSMDRTIHPFIYAQIVSLRKQYPKSSDSFLHCQIESALDVIVLRYENAELPTEFNLKKTIPKNPDVLKKIAEIYVFVFQKLYGRKVGIKAILQAERDCRFVVGLQNDHTGLKKQLFQRFEKKHDKYLCSCFFRGILEDEEFDYANILASPWSWPFESPKKRTESFLDLYEFSAVESADFMLRIFKTNNMLDFSKQIPFS